MLNRDNIVLAGSAVSLVKLESISGLRFDSTGLKDDDFGKSFVNDFKNENDNNVWTFQELKKYILWKLSIGERII